MGGITPPDLRTAPHRDSDVHSSPQREVAAAHFLWSVLKAASHPLSGLGLGSTTRPITPLMSPAHRHMPCRPPNRKMQRLLPSGGSSTASQEVKSTRLSSAENEDDLSDGQSNFRSHTAQLSRELGARSVWCNARSSNDHSHSVAADYKQNPFSLVYGGAITKNELGKVNIHSVTYQLSGLDVVANAMFRAARCSAARRPYCCRLAGRMATRPPAIILGG